MTSRRMADGSGRVGFGGLMSKENLEISLTPDQRVRLWVAFARGNVQQVYSGPQDEHWSAGVDRILVELQTMLWAGEITLEDLGFRFEARVEGGGGPGESASDRT